MAYQLNSVSGVGTKVITHRTVQRLLDGKDPKDKDIRYTLARVMIDYDFWRAAHMAELEQIVAWAEARCTAEQSDKS